MPPATHQSQHVQSSSCLHSVSPHANMWYTTAIKVATVQGQLPDLQAFTEFFNGFSKCHKVIIDCTANAQVPLLYAAWLSSGIHVVTPNKKLCSGPLSEWTRVSNAAKEHGTHFKYEVMASAVHDVTALSCQTSRQMHPSHTPPTPLSSPLSQPCQTPSSTLPTAPDTTPFATSLAMPLKAPLMNPSQPRSQCPVTTLHIMPGTHPLSTASHLTLQSLSSMASCCSDM